MLTQADLQEIVKVLTPRFESIDQRFEKIDFELRAVKKSVKKLEKNSDMMLGFLDRQDVELKKRIIRIEEHLHISP